jgi:hypothetical protein
MLGTVLDAVFVVVVLDVCSDRVSVCWGMMLSCWMLSSLLVAVLVLDDVGCYC